MKRGPVFFDASGWIAIINLDDRNHAAAEAIYRELLADKVRIVTTNWTVYEALSIIKDKIGYREATALWEVVETVPLVRMVKITDDIEEAGLDLFFRYRDKTWGVVDYTSLIVMELIGCFQALAFDRHFIEAGTQRGFQVIPRSLTS